MATARQIIIDERKKLTELVIKNLEKDGLNWVKGWGSQGTPKNGTTDIPYSRGNKIKLMIIADQKGLEDPRWATFKQAQSKGWKVKKGAKSVALEKWIFTRKEKDKLTGEEKLIKLEKPIANYFRVFNADDIDGISPINKVDKLEFNKTNLEFIEKIKKSSECKILEKNQDKAYYSSANDHIVLPLKENFKSHEEFLGTMLHEMAHSTGHSSRLDRKLGNKFGSPEYAKEELRAEISSIFTQNELGLKLKDNHIENHSAYIKSWIKVLKEDNNEIYKAASDSEKIAERLVGNFRKLEKEKMEPRGKIVFPQRRNKNNELER